MLCRPFIPWPPPLRACSRLPGGDYEVIQLCRDVQHLSVCAARTATHLSESAERACCCAPEKCHPLSRRQTTESSHHSSLHDECVNSQLIECYPSLTNTLNNSGPKRQFLIVEAQRASEAGHSVDDCSDDWTTGRQRALPMRLGPQIQTVLSRQRRRPGQHGPRRSGGGSDSAVGGGGAGSHPSPEDHTQQPWKKATSRGLLGRSRTPRKVGGG